MKVPGILLAEVRVEKPGAKSPISSLMILIALFLHLFLSHLNRAFPFPSLPPRYVDFYRKNCFAAVELLTVTPAMNVMGS